MTFQNPVFLLIEIGTLALAAGIAWGVVRANMTSMLRRLDDMEHKTGRAEQKAESARLEVHDRLARVETKLDMLLSLLQQQAMRDASTHIDQRGSG